MLPRTMALLPDLTQSIRRFPEAAIAALGCTACALLLWNSETGRTITQPSVLEDLHVVLAVLFPVMLALGLYAENHAVNPRARLALMLAGVAVVYALIFAQFTFDTSRPLLAAAAFLLPCIAAHIGKPKDNAAFWAYNHDLLLGLAMAAAGAALFCVAVYAIFSTVSALFQIAVPPRMYDYARAIAVNLAGPLIWMTLAPRSKAGTIVIDTSQTSSRAIALVAKFILVPVLLLYTAIIYVYAAKIGIDRTLPKGQIGWMVLAYAGAGTATLLAIYPTRDTGGPLVNLFWRHWFALTLLPVALLFVAIFTRTSEYGFTDKRYLLSLAGVWIAAQAIVFGARAESERDLRTIMLTALAAVALATAGPWGAAGSTARLLARDFRHLVTSSASYRDGMIGQEVTADSKSRMLSIIKYLSANGRLDLVDGLVKRDPTATYEDFTTPAATAGERRRQGARFADALGLPGREIGYDLDQRTYFSFFSSRPAVIPGKGNVAGVISISRYGDPVVLDTHSGAVELTMSPASLKVRLPGGAEAAFPVEDLGAQIKAAQAHWAAIPASATPIKLTASDAAGVEIYILTGNGFTSDTQTEVTNLTLFVAWPN